jgi:Holliday junction resolvase RusA-like endonuclease
MPHAERYIITVRGEAKPEAKRQRFIEALKRPGKRVDLPDRADWKAVVRNRAADIIPEPMEGPLAVEIVVTQPTPPSYPKRPTRTNPWPWAWWKRPDGDNLNKPIWDALTGVAWQDDGQVTDLAIRKRLGTMHETRIVIARAQPDPAEGTIVVHCVNPDCWHVRPLSILDLPAKLKCPLCDLKFEVGDLPKRVILAAGGNGRFAEYVPGDDPLPLALDLEPAAVGDGE